MFSALLAGVFIANNLAKAKLAVRAQTGSEPKFFLYLLSTLLIVSLSNELCMCGPQY